jgi:ATP-dependent helicase/DNAse subunit B
MERFREALDRDPVLVVPTGDDVATFERQLCEQLGGSIATFGALTGQVAKTLAPMLVPELTGSQRQALIRAAITRVEPRQLRRSASRPGFAPALDALIAELQAALISPGEFATIVAELDDPGYETELAALYAAYVELRDAGGRGDSATTLAAATAALRADPESWGGRPVVLYGFDDLTRAQLELVDALGRAGEVTVAVAFTDRRALAVRAELITRLEQELGATRTPELAHDDGYTTSATLRHLDRSLFEPGVGKVEPDDGLVLLESAGARGEAEAIGIEIARLIEGGHEPDEIAVVVRHPASAGPLLASVLRDLGVPVALEASTPLSATAVGGSLRALCRAASDESAVGALLTHLRLDPSLPPGLVDTVERRTRRGDAQTVSAATDHWKTPPVHLTRLREAGNDAARLRALARSARELAEGAHRKQAPLVGPGRPGVPFSAVELRAGVAASELLEELSAIGRLSGCEQPGLAAAVEALESASVALWRGPAVGRVRIMSPYRARAARARALFVASLQDGEFPSAAPPDPLLSEARRREIGNPDLRRAEQADEERYLFHSCVSRPTERLYLSWQSCDEDGTALARSPFVDEVLDLLAPNPAEAERRLARTRGPERAVFAPAEATNERELARALALGGWSADRAAVLERLDVGPRAAAVEALFDGLEDPNAVPGPLAVPAVVADLGAREVFSANSLEGWITCPYKWFVEHELQPQRLEPEADPLWLGSVVHDALERLYREPPGEDAIPRPGDVGRWRQRFAELLELGATERARAPLNHSRRAAIERARIQVEAFLEAEAETDSEFRPRPELLEVTFGPFDEDELEDAEAGPSHDALRLGAVALRGRIDRIDVDDGGRAIVRDYKTGKSVSRAEAFVDEGTLQIQLYMRVAERVLGLEPVAGLYHPLGAVGPDKRRPRGLVAHEDERLKGLGIVGRDRREAEEFEAALDEAEASAERAAGEMGAGRIGRRPLGGKCPKYCSFQAICRLERAVGAVGEQSGGEDR